MSTTNARPNVSDDLLWEIVRPNNAYLVKRNSGGGVQFSRDPYNLKNIHSRTHAGFINSKAVSIQPGSEGKGVNLSTKNVKKSHQPKSSLHTQKFKAGRSNRSIYGSTANTVGKNSYRSDLNMHAVQRTSAILDSQRPKKDTPEKKPRGLKGAKTDA